MESTITLSWSDIVALWGGITGTLGLIIAYKTYSRDKADIKIQLMESGIIGPGHPRYSSDETYAVLTVINRGRRPVTVTNVAFKFLNQTGSCIPSDSMYYNPQEILEGKSATYLMPRASLGLKEVSYFFVTDAVGKEYRYYYAPRLKVLLFDLLHMFYLKRKKLSQPGIRKHKK